MKKKGQAIKSRYQGISLPRKSNLDEVLAIFFMSANGTQM
jgi:hypothetical protein